MKGLQAGYASRRRAVGSVAPGLLRLRWWRGVVAFGGLALALAAARVTFFGGVPLAISRPELWWLVLVRLAFIVPPLLLFAVAWAFLDIVPGALRPGALLMTGGLAAWMTYELGVAWGGVPRADQTVDLVLGGLVVTGMVLYLFGGLVESRALRQLAECDPLTGLLNRAGAQRAWDDTLAAGDVVLAMVDLNDLKTLNDGLGHAAGDHLILACSRVLSRACGTRGWVARWGGDEFVAVLPGVSEPVARALLADAETNVIRVAGDLPVWAAGLAAVQDGQSLRDVVRLADARMYREKALQYRVREPEAVRGATAAYYGRPAQPS